MYIFLLNANAKCYFAFAFIRKKNPKYIIYINIKYIVLNLMNNNIYLNMHNHINDKNIKKSLLH